MPVVTKKLIERVLTARLNLRDPRFKLYRLGGRFSGSVVDSSFEGKDDLERLNKIHDALESEFQLRARSTIGMILAYTPFEWDVPLEGEKPVRVARKSRSTNGHRRA